MYNFYCVYIIATNICHSTIFSNCNSENVRNQAEYTKSVQARSHFMHRNMCKHPLLFKKLMAGKKKKKCIFKLLHQAEKAFPVIIIHDKYVRMGKNEEKRPKD